MAAVKLKKTDVVIVGLGCAGGLAALPLARAGLKIVGLEAGPRWTERDFVADELRDSINNRMGNMKANREVMTRRFFSNETAITPAGTIHPMMNGVGGTTIHWTGQSWRLHPWNFKVRSEAIRRYGPGAIPSNSTVADWPLSYEDLEPFYDRVEYLHGVSGKAGNIRGRIDNRGNVFEGPRAREYPLPPLRETGFMQLMSSAATRLGWHPFRGPAGIRSRAYRGLPACEYHGHCTRSGCHAGAKAGTQLTGIPQAEDTGNLKVVTGARVTSITVGPDARATGVLYVKGERMYWQPADVVVLAAYTYENVRLLLMSKSAAFPNGLSNNHGQVGKHFVSHSGFGVSALFPGRRLNRWYGTGSQWVAVDDFEGGAMDSRGEFISHSGLFSNGGEQKPIATANNTPPSIPTWGPVWKDWIRKNGNSIGGASIQLDMLTYDHNFLDLDPTHRDRFGIPRIRVTYRFTDHERRAFAFYRARMVQWLMEAGASETWGATAPTPNFASTHAAGGARMGHDPDSSVVNTFGFSHEVPNLAVLGGATFPGIAGRNPTETIWALAYRTADHLAKNWKAIAD